MTDERLRLAIRNNIAAYGGVFHTHGLQGIQRERYWLALSPPPPYHSSLVTTDPALAADEIASALADIRSGGFKDSFACVDGERIGFSALFDARWIYRAGDMPAPQPSMRWQVLAAAEDLDAWKRLHGTADALLPGLMELRDFAVLRGENGQGGTVGALANLSDSVVGISNTFAAGVDLPAAWWELVAAFGQRFPGRAIVGYERGDDLAAALDAGFAELGPLRVWVR